MATAPTLQAGESRPLTAAFEMSIWMLGSLSEKSWDHIALAAPFMIAGIGLLSTTGRAIDALEKVGTTLSGEEGKIEKVEAGPALPGVEDEDLFK